MTDKLESIIRWAAAASGIGAILVALIITWRQSKRPSAAEYGKGAGLTAKHWYLLALTVIYFGTMVILWRPVPISFTNNTRVTLDIIGAAIFFPSVALYLSGMHALGTMFGPSSAFGARLYAGHQLVTSGPYSFIRHPMYAGVICAGVGGLFIYRTWGILFFASTMFGLIARARIEEKLLAQEFGRDWEEYKNKVPAWIPKLGKS